jgi:hypothetical protein
VAANFCHFLSAHAAVFVEVDRVFRHDLITFLLVANSAPIINGVSGGSACRAGEAFSASRRQSRFDPHSKTARFRVQLDQGQDPSEGAIPDGIRKLIVRQGRAHLSCCFR